MTTPQDHSLSKSFIGDLNLLFYQRALFCLWLCAIFFSFFSLLDYICYPEHFYRFGLYRLAFVLTLLFMVAFIRLPVGRRHVRLVIYVGMLLGSMTISLMTVELGGFVSGYYVGILLMMAGGFTVLPFTVSQAIVTGLSMYCVYMVTVITAIETLESQAIRYALNNSFFFFCITGVTAIQSFDDLRIQLKALQSQKSLRSLKAELVKYKDNLEELVRQRVQQKEESELRFKDLYNNIDDLIVVIDGMGVIQESNGSAAKSLAGGASTLYGRSLSQFFPDQENGKSVTAVVSRLESGETISSLQLQLQTEQKLLIEAEMSGTRVYISGSDPLYQLIIRDISATKEMERKVLESNRLLDSSRQAAIFGLAHLAECRDDETGAHLTRIREYTLLLADVLEHESEVQQQVTESFKEDIYRSSVLHDIGKVGIPDDILLKPGKLIDEEMRIMQQHCYLGSQVLQNAEEMSGVRSFLTMGQEICCHHHERWDGTGYPEKLAGTEIPLAARIVALADVYDALTSRRTYKPAYSHDHARQFIISRSGKHFDPLVVKAFLRQESEFKRVRKNLLLNG